MNRRNLLSAACAAASLTLARFFCSPVASPPVVVSDEPVEQMLGVTYRISGGEHSAVDSTFVTQTSGWSVTIGKGCDYESIEEWMCSNSPSDSLRSDTR